jgi:hypothetical protein
MNRYKVNLKSGYIKQPLLENAGDDFEVGDVVTLDGDKVMPMYSEDQKMYGVAAAAAKKGGKVLIAATGADK